MGLRFRKAIKLLPGVRLNISKTGASVSLGGKGLTCNINKKGTKTTIGVPGTGLSYSSYDPHEDKSLSNNTNAGYTINWFFIIAAILVIIMLLSR